MEDWDTVDMEGTYEIIAKSFVLRKTSVNNSIRRCLPFPRLRHTGIIKLRQPYGNRLIFCNWPRQVSVQPRYLRKESIPKFRSSLLIMDGNFINRSHFGRSQMVEEIATITKKRKAFTLGTSSMPPSQSQAYSPDRTTFKHTYHFRKSGSTRLQNTAL